MLFVPAFYLVPGLGAFVVLIVLFLAFLLAIIAFNLVPGLALLLVLVALLLFLVLLAVPLVRCNILACNVLVAGIRSGRPLPFLTPRALAFRNRVTAKPATNNPPTAKV